jgi:hypothetical protein
VNLTLSPSCGRIVESQADVVIACGPRREGKTVTGYVKWIVEAGRLVPDTLPLKVLVIRDTWTNLDKTTIETLRELQRMGLQVKFQKDSTEALVGNGLVKFYFIGMDRPERLNTLQGLGAGGLWVEEPAPAADLANGVAAEVFAVGMTSLSQKGRYRDGGELRHKALITMNPPDVDHWTVAIRDEIEQQMKAQGDKAPIKLEWLNIPKGDNRHVADFVRARNKAALEAIGRKDLVARLVEGQIGQIIVGEPVTPEYSDKLHVADAPLPIIRGYPIIRGWDFGLNPSCHISQVTPSGRWHWLDTLVGQNIGLEQMIETMYWPWAELWLGTPAGVEAARRSDWSFRDIGDPAGYIREQTNSDRSAVKVLTEMLNASFEAGPVEWAERRDALKACFTRIVRGVPLIQINPGNRIIQRACRGGAHYPKDALGRITQTADAYKRASGIHSHPFDAATYAAARLYPLGEKRVTNAPKPKPSNVPASLRWQTA